MKSVVFSLLLSALFVDHLYSMNLKIIDRHLDNKDCKSGISYKSWEDAWEQNRNIKIKSDDRSFIKFAALHYTAERNVKAAYWAYNEWGISAHYTIDLDGAIYCTVDPKKCIAYHAGPSAFGGYLRLNDHSIGIEHVNPGCGDTCKIITGFAEPIQITGDSRWWYPFGDKQFESSCVLTRNIQEEYEIPGWNVVTHADVSIGRKSDIGPLWNYKRAFDEYNVGYWYTESHQIKPEIMQCLSDADYVRFIKAIGYTSDNEEQLIKAYQMHYVCSEIHGILTDNTKEAVLRHVIGLTNYVSPVTGEKYEYFNNNLQKWMIDNPNKVAMLSEYFYID